MPARANNSATRRGADARLPIAIKIVLTLLLSTLFLALVVSSDRNSSQSPVPSQGESNLQTETQR